MEYCNLHCHTDFSVFDGFAKLDELVARAKELEYPALAISDHGTTTGLVAFYNECRKQGIKPILGYEAYLVSNLNIKADEMYHLLILAKNLQGYRNLLKLATIGTEHFYKKPRIDLKSILDNKEGLIISTACMGGLFKHPEYQRYILQFKEALGEDFYLEIQPNTLPEQKVHNELVMAMSKMYEVKPLVTIDSHYVRREDAPVHRQWKRLADDSEYYTTDDYYLMSEGEIRKRLAYLPDDFVTESIESSIIIANNCNVAIPFDEQNYPTFEVEDPIKYIKDICNKGWNELGLGKKKNKAEYLKQANMEFDILNKVNYGNYLCIIHDIVNWARTNMKDHYAPVGFGRGSVVGSLVSYMMGITAIDPIEYNLVFERFANLERISPADVDCDFPKSRRIDVIDYIKEKYGSVYQIRTTNYIGEKAALQRAGQALKVPPYEVDRLSKNMNTLEELPSSALRNLALKFVGHVQNFGVHASAVVVFPEAPYKWVAIEKSGDNQVAAISDFKLLEEQGILKLDILGLETLDIINDAMHNINKTQTVKLSDVDLACPKTAEMLMKGHTHGCFQIESGIMTKIVKGISAKNVHDLIHCVALGRPGTLDSGMTDVFIKRRQGLEPLEYLHPKLKSVLGDTEGVILYQEQIMQIARELCGYSYGESDVLRYIIGKKKLDKMGPAIEQFINRGVANGIDRETITTISDQIVTFALYGFNRGHSAAYGYTSWVTAWLKANYPAEFIAALLTSVAGEKDKLVNYILHAKEMGVEVLSPSITESVHDCASTPDGKVRLGFGCISGVGHNEVPTDTENFIEFMEAYGKLNKTCIKNLVKAGCFKGDRNKMLVFVDWFKDKRKSKPPFEECLKDNLTPQEYSDMERESIGFSFENKMALYDLSSVNGTSIVGLEIVSVKAHKTKAGNPMAFVKARDQRVLRDLVIFDEKFKEFQQGEVYLMKLADSRILDFCKAKRVA